jgi:uncharacterized protein (DUF433 family)
MMIEGGPGVLTGGNNAMSEERANGYIVHTPGVCGGKPRIAGHRITVQHIAIDHEQLGMSPVEICEAYEGLTLSEVHAALAYYFDHREEIQASIRAGEQLVEEFKRRHPESVRGE